MFDRGVLLIRFSARLTEVMKQHGMGMSPTKLAHQFNQRYWGQSITVGAAGNWINGKSLPQLDKLVVLSELFNTSIDCLVK